MRYTITAPVATFTGEVAGVGFASGVATLDTERPGAGAALTYFSRKGYTVEPVEEPKAEPEPESEVKETPKRPRRAGAKEEETEQ